MHLLLAPLALSFLQAAGGAPTAATELPDLTLEQSSSLRCSVAFGLVHRAQNSGEEAAADFSGSQDTPLWMRRLPIQFCM